MKCCLCTQSHHAAQLQGALFTWSAVVPGSAVVAALLLGVERMEGTGKETRVNQYWGDASSQGVFLRYPLVSSVQGSTGWEQAGGLWTLLHLPKPQFVIINMARVTIYFDTQSFPLYIEVSSKVHPRVG